MWFEILALAGPLIGYFGLVFITEKINSEDETVFKPREHSTIPTKHLEDAMKAVNKSLEEPLEVQMIIELLKTSDEWVKITKGSANIILEHPVGIKIGRRNFEVPESIRHLYPLDLLVSVKNADGEFENVTVGKNFGTHIDAYLARQQSARDEARTKALAQRILQRTPPPPVLGGSGVHEQPQLSNSEKSVGLLPTPTYGTYYADGAGNWQPIDSGYSLPTDCIVNRDRHGNYIYTSNYRMAA